MRRLGVVAALAAAFVVPATAGAAETKYSLANGCFAASGLPGAEQVRMQATGLGSYLLYRPDRTFVALVDGAPSVATAPSPAADWTVEPATGGAFTLAAKADPAKPFTVTFTPAMGCADYPEAELDATGTPAKGATSYGSTQGLVEGHMHWMSYQYFGGNFHCGAPWDPYGITSALPDCSSVEGPQGTTASFQNFLNYGNPAQAHDTRGYPTMAQTDAGNLTVEGTYWKWIQRAWMSGLRVMVMGVNENRVLCELQTNRKHGCNEMDTVRTGFKALHELEDYVDAQSGGPGKGFFQIVTDPYEARRVVNQGRMAVIQEVEISEPFDCANIDAPTCDQAQVDRQLDELYKLGVRSSLLLNKFDNPLTGVRFDAGITGVVINEGNKASAGQYWSAETCKGALADNTIQTLSPQADAVFSQLLATVGIQSGTTPNYPPAPHCNTRGLTTLGKHVVNRMMDLKMIVNPDHMSQAGVDETLTLLEARDYSGVISPHGWMDPGNWPRLWKLGGMAFPGHSSATSYVDEWKKFRPKSTPYKFGWGYGADLGGLSHQPEVEGDGAITYPFKSYDGSVTFERQKTGDRTFDYTKEGVAHYGLYPDWFEDLRRLGGQAMVDDMLAGAESYLEMWERADGVPDTACHTRGGPIGPGGRGDLHIGPDWVTLLKSAGQPQQRTRAWSWCVRGPRNVDKADVAVLSKAGRVELVGTTARRFAGPFRVGNRASFKGIKRRGRYVALARRGRIRAAGAAARTLKRKAVKRDIRRVAAARASQVTKPAFTPADAQRAGRLTGYALAGASNPELNRALTLYCQLQLG